MTTHCSMLWRSARSRWIDGKATFTIATSSTTMNSAAQDSARATPLPVVGLLRRRTEDGRGLGLSMSSLSCLLRRRFALVQRRVNP